MSTQHCGETVLEQRQAGRGISAHGTSWFLEGRLGLVSEGPGVKLPAAASNGRGPGGSRKLQHSPPASIPGGCDPHPGFPGQPGPSCPWKLLPVPFRFVTWASSFFLW